MGLEKGKSSAKAGSCRAKTARPRRVYFTDGESIAAPGQDRIEKIDFLDQCRKRYADAKKPAAEDEDHRAVFQRMRQTALGQIEQPDLALAAWLYRLDQPELAAKALERAAEARGSSNREAPPHEKEEARMVRLLKEELAWPAFAAMVHAYMVRADEEALAHGERLLRLYPDIVKTEYAQADAVVGELKRRKAKGTFGKEPPYELAGGVRLLGTQEEDRLAHRLPGGSGRAAVGATGRRAAGDGPPRGGTHRDRRSGRPGPDRRRGKG